ncbi:hypothetical protein [Roseovarius conchicola]|uniref:hypothetical protein n=1 Tax=Roseovarius conchicola TaxID=3121636 RepID=UPI003B96969D
MRGIKAEGGWGVVFTEQCEMHHISETTPFIELRRWFVNAAKRSKVAAFDLICFVAIPWRIGHVLPKR